MAIKHDNVMAMYNLGCLYHFHLHEYTQAKKYYLMAIEKGCNMAMNNLGSLYFYNLCDCIHAKKYYMMAIENGNAEAIINLQTLSNYDFYYYYKLGITKACYPNICAWMQKYSTVNDDIVRLSNCISKFEIYVADLEKKMDIVTRRIEEMAL